MENFFCGEKWARDRNFGVNKLCMEFKSMKLTEVTRMIRVDRDKIIRVSFGLIPRQRNPEMRRDPQRLRGECKVGGKSIESSEYQIKQVLGEGGSHPPGQTLLIG
jgi:hypothetical protein